jgi:excisionase family DNA binding protein
MSHEQKQLFIWESDVTPAGEGRAMVTARKPLFRMSVGQAAKMLGCEKDTVWRAFRAGLITGWKPGARAHRKDGRKSNAALVLDAGSVLAYKESVTQRGVF